MDGWVGEWVSEGGVGWLSARSSDWVGGARVWVYIRAYICWF